MVQVPLIVLRLSAIHHQSHPETERTPTSTYAGDFVFELIIRCHQIFCLIDCLIYHISGLEQD